MNLTPWLPIAQMVPPPRGGPPMVQQPPPPNPMDNSAVVAVVLVVIGLTLLFFGVFAAITAAQAKRRGYLFIPWLFAGMLGNPIFLLVMLGVMPDFRRRKLRQKEAEDLKRLLARKPPRGAEKAAAGPQPAPPPPRGLRGTRGRPVDRSLGDEVTQDVPERSLGDDETRM